MSTSHASGERPSVNRFRLRVNDSRKAGARTSASGRRTVSACWHVHRDVMEAIFAVNPDVVIVSALATYNGKEDFEHKHLATHYHNAGSRMYPAQFGDLCDC